MKAHDHNLDISSVIDFCEFLGYREEEFWKIIDIHYNKDLFMNDIFGNWILRDPIC